MFEEGSKHIVDTGIAGGVMLELLPGTLLVGERVMLETSSIAFSGCGVVKLLFGVSTWEVRFGMVTFGRSMIGVISSVQLVDPVQGVAIMSSACTSA